MDESSGGGKIVVVSYGDSRMKALITALVVIGLWACNNAASPETTHVDQTRNEDSGFAPGAGATEADTAAGTPSATDPVRLDTLNRQTNR